MANAKNGDKPKRFTKENFVRAFNRENIAKAAFTALAAFSILAVVAIVFFILYSSIPAFQYTNFFKFLFGSEWSGSNTEGEGVYGILPMIVTSIVLTFFSVLVGGILAVFTAVFIAFYCPKWLKKIYSQIINLLAGIPSIIFGYFGLQLIKPLLQDAFGVVSASGVFLSTIILSIMILPTIASMVKNSLDNVPKEYFEGSLALGNTKNQTIFRVILPAAKKGIIAAMILGVGRAVGETMAVQLLLGGKVNYPTSLFIGVRSLTSNIVSEFSYATNTWRSSLIATGLVLLIFILLINILLWFVKNDKGVSGNGLFKRSVKDSGNGQENTAARAYYNKGLVSNILMCLSYFVAILVAVMLVFIVAYVFIEGIPYLTADFVFGESSYGHVTMAPAFVNTLLVILVALVVALPLGIGAAIYLNEYAKRGGKFVQIVRLFIDTLSGVPSIIFGIFGAILFVQYCNMGYSLWAGGLTMALMILPTIIRSTEQNLSEIPDSMREASYALGAGKLRTVFVVILPQALAGIITGVILAVGRIIGETAALIYTAGMGIHMNASLSSSGATLAVLIYYMYSEGLQTGEAFAVATMLIIFVFILNLLVSFVEYVFHNKINNQKGLVGKMIEKIKNRKTKKEINSYDNN